MADVRSRNSWITSHDDHIEHAVTDIALEASNYSGRFEAVCGDEVLSAAMDTGPSGRCPRCVTFLRARAEMRGLDDRMRTAPRPGWWSRLTHPAGGHPQPRGRHSA
jgi:hypothetical protein